MPGFLFEILNKSCTVGWEDVEASAVLFRFLDAVDEVPELAFEDDVEAIKSALTGKFYAVCCFAAVRGVNGASFEAD